MLMACAVEKLMGRGPALLWSPPPGAETCREHIPKENFAYRCNSKKMQYKPDPPTPYATVARGQAPGLFSPAVSASVSAAAPSTHRSVVSHTQGHFDDKSPPVVLKPVNYTRVETAFLIEETKARLLRLYQQEESLGLHLEAKRHSLLHLKSEIARTDQLIRDFERKRVFDLQQDANDTSLSHKDMEEVEKLSQDILIEERSLSQLQALLEETQVRKAAFQELLHRDIADRAEIKAAITKLSGKFPPAR
jgi:hypothetical protein